MTKYILIHRFKSHDFHNRALAKKEQELGYFLDFNAQSAAACNVEDASESKYESHFISQLCNIKDAINAQ